MIPYRLRGISIDTVDAVPLGRDSCPLCYHLSDIRAAAAHSFGVRCRTCGSFVIDDQLTQVIANARSRGLRKVLDHLPLLSVAARDACDCDQPLTLTSTNWVRISQTAQLSTEDRGRARQ